MEKKLCKTCNHFKKMTKKEANEYGNILGQKPIGQCCYFPDWKLIYENDHYCTLHWPGLKQKEV